MFIFFFRKTDDVFEYKNFIPFPWRIREVWYWQCSVLSIAVAMTLTGHSEQAWHGCYSQEQRNFSANSQNKKKLLNIHSCRAVFCCTKSQLCCIQFMVTVSAVLEQFNGGWLFVCACAACPRPALSVFVSCGMLAQLLTFIMFNFAS